MWGRFLLTVYVLLAVATWIAAVWFVFFTRPEKSLFVPNAFDQPAYNVSPR